MHLRFRLAVVTLALLTLRAAIGAEIGFTIREYKISGAQVAPEIVSPFLGENRSIDDIQRAAHAVEQQLGKGWKVIIVPDQDVTDGTIRFQAIQAAQPRIISVQDTSSIAGYFTSMRIDRPFDPARARTQAALFRDLTGEFAQVDAQADRSGIAVTLLADPSLRKTPLRFSLGVDNAGSKETGLNRVTMTASHNNLWDRHHVGSVAAVFSTAKPEDVRVLVGSYRLPLFDQDSVLDFYAADSKAASGEAAGLAIRGKGTILGARATRYFSFEDTAGTHQVFSGIEQRNLDSEVTLGGTAIKLAPDYAVRPLTIGYTYTQAGRLATTVSISRGLGGGTAGNDVVGNVRVGARSNYTILRANGEFLWPVVADVTGRVTANIQYTTDALVPAEQFGLGGAWSIRGLQEREVSNDKGYRVSAELSKPISGDNRALAFVDLGRISRNNALPGDPGTENVASAGVGIRFGERNKWSGSVDLAHVLRGTQVTASGENRVHFQLTVFF